MDFPHLKNTHCRDCECNPFHVCFWLFLNKNELILLVIITRPSNDLPSIPNFDVYIYILPKLVNLIYLKPILDNLM